jgi:4-deoxy-L-threo-5-hexosulose-uronate ketol-isomerase
MDVRYGTHPREVKSFDTAALRDEFLIDGLFAPGEVKMVYSHNDRMIIGSICPLDPILLSAGDELKARYFLERREMGVINIGGKGTVTIDGTSYGMDNRDGIYIGMGARDVVFSSANANDPARFYFNSAPAHFSYAVTKVDISKAEPARLGSVEESNRRTIYKYFHPNGVKSCQLVMGMTVLEPGSVWNSMPCHTHERRMEVYLYFDLPYSDHHPSDLRQKHPQSD